jgi:hypothetical protein
MSVDVTVLSFDGCPNGERAHARVRTVLRQLGAPEHLVTVRQVETEGRAQRLFFRGSATVLVNGEDPFADASAPVGLSCRVYRTATGLSGAPAVHELAAALRAAG